MIIGHISNTILNVLPFLEHNKLYFYGFLFMLSLFESTPIIGTFTPGSIVLLLFGFLAFQGYAPFSLILIVAVVGAVIGDVIGYYAGKYGQDFFKGHKFISRFSHLDAAKVFFLKHGGKSVTIGRFIGPVRPVISIFAGMSGLKFYTFFWWNILGAFLWCALYLALGFVFGAHWRSLHKWVARIGLLMSVVSIGGVYIYIARKKVAQRFKVSEEKVPSFEEEPTIEVK